LSSSQTVSLPGRVCLEGGWSLFTNTAGPFILVPTISPFFLRPKKLQIEELRVLARSQFFIFQPSTFGIKTLFIWGILPSGKRLQKADLKPWPSRKFVDFPSYKMMILHSYVNVYQRVTYVKHQNLRLNRQKDRKAKIYRMTLKVYQ